MVSKRAAELAADTPAIAVAHLAAEADPYHPERNPGGYLNLGTAENRLVWDLLEPRVAAARRVRPEDVRYAPLYGTAALREAAAPLLAATWRSPVDPENLVVVSGATAALDIIASVLCDPGDALVVPAPYYGALPLDLCGRSGARLLPAPLSAADGFRLDPGAVDRALAEARAEGLTARAVVLTSPCNPTGNVHPPAVLRACLEVAERHGVDVIADEIYANSVYGPDTFTSLLDPRVREGGTVRVHTVWGFAKDFGLSGLKAGVLHTEDPEVLAAARALAYFAPVSTDTQALLSALLADGPWAADFLDRNRDRLARSYRHAADTLAAHGVGHVPASGGFSIWTDLRPWLAGGGFGAEHALWQRIWERTRVNLLPGQVFGSPEPGWFRICHTTDPAVVRDALTRLGRLLESVGAPSRPAGAGRATHPPRP
ncbi:aminotransferase class I/II-fold pyridoxal phosphate-dependent enzyme [Allonocardiopsis opalescens]|uniref:Aminotransferase n=1 Tax=Allonocardiopsis opalescens TaxID=1144618 RepID=A0A2T0Q411_9ACTN|nr:aminotransferase class I/II-fold pyridoxal phosphate-dependent enzyme [Allonocardiopsis opalescens]PRX98539.1 aminotransferase [Allonocardiopsis opalescens]